MLKIYSVSHKEIERFAPERIPLGVGANRNMQGIELYDNVGENIAKKNKSFCELTALYWIWKNTDDEAVGFEHYRRFFCRENLFGYRPLTKNEMCKILKTHDVLLPRMAKAKTNMYDYYAAEHYQSDMDICGEIIQELYPEYFSSYKRVLGQKYGSMANMFVMKKSLMDKYCEWIFSILFEAEKRIDYSDRDAYQQRVFGFLSERLFNVWVEHNNLKVCYKRIHGYGDGCMFGRVFRQQWKNFKGIFSKKQSKN